MRDVLIIGGGPAGLTAALYAARAGLSVTILEKLMAGGQAAQTNRIENYPGFADGIGGPELCMEMERQAVQAGAQIQYEGAIEVNIDLKRVRTDSGWHQARAIVLAMGAHPRRLHVNGEERFIGRGVSFCATCDGALYRGKRVAVIGGGNSAAEEALYLSGIGCHVLLVHRRNALRAEEAVAKEVLSRNNVLPLWNSQVEAFLGDAKLSSLQLNGGRTEPVDAAFVSVGRVPDTSLVAGQVPMDPQGFLMANDLCQTGIPGIYAIGDARSKPLRQIVTAVSDGAIAASEVSRYITNM